MKESVKLTQEIDAGTKTIDSNLSKKELISIIIGCRPSLKISAWNLCKGGLTKEDLLLILGKCRHRRFINVKVISTLLDLEGQLSEEDLRKIIGNKYVGEWSRKETNEILGRNFPTIQDILPESQDLKLEDGQKENDVGSVKLPAPAKKRGTTLPGNEFVVIKKHKEIGDWRRPWEQYDY